MDDLLPARPGDTIAGKYRLERVLGRGGMGVVFSARHLVLRERVAIKMLSPELADHAVVVARFLREARAAAMIKGDHVVRVLDVDTTDGTTFLVMEFLDGENLGELLAREAPLAADAAVDLVLHACDALAEAHQMGIVHRDLKPANLFLSRRHDGTRILKVLDFGISKFDPVAHGEPALTDTSHPLGTPLYMSPEQLASAARVDGRSDIWSLGVVLYECLSGERPFKSILDTLNAEPPALRGDRALGVVVSRCLAKKADDRFADIAELATALAPFATPEGRRVVERIARYLARQDEQTTLIELRETHDTDRDPDPALATTDAATTRPLPPKAAPQPALPDTLGATSSAKPASLIARRPSVMMLAAAGILVAFVVVAYAAISRSPEPAAPAPVAAQPSVAASAASAAAPPASSITVTPHESPPSSASPVGSVAAPKKAPPPLKPKPTKPKSKTKSDEDI